MREAKAAIDLGVKTIGEPTAMFLGRDVEFMRRVVRGDRPAGHPLHRDLHLRLPAAVLRQPRPGPDRRPLRAGHRGGDPGDRDQGRLHQVRGRRARGEREHREGPPGGRPRQRSHRGADHGPLPAGQQHRARGRSRSSSRRESIRRRSRSPTPETPTISTTSRGCWRRASGSASTAMAWRSSFPTRSASRRPKPCSSVATPIGSSSRRTRWRRSTGSPPT